MGVARLAKRWGAPRGVHLRGKVRRGTEERGTVVQTRQIEETTGGFVPALICLGWEEGQFHLWEQRGPDIRGENKKKKGASRNDGKKRDSWSDFQRFKGEKGWGPRKSGVLARTLEIVCKFRTDWAGDG